MQGIQPPTPHQSELWYIQPPTPHESELVYLVAIAVLTRWPFDLNFWERTFVVASSGVAMWVTRHMIERYQIQHIVNS